MRLDDGSTAICLLAWERRLGFPDGALAAAQDRLLKRDDGAQVLQFVRLWGRSALSGPGWVLEPRHGTSAMTSWPTMPHCLGSAGTTVDTVWAPHPFTLPMTCPCSSPPTRSPFRMAAPRLAELESLCPPDDVNEAGLGDLEHRFTVMHDGGPVACGAYTEWQGILAQLGVLVAPATGGPGPGDARRIHCGPRGPGHRTDPAVADRRQQFRGQRPLARVAGIQLGRDTDRHPAGGQPTTPRRALLGWAPLAQRRRAARPSPKPASAWQRTSPRLPPAQSRPPAA